MKNKIEVIIYTPIDFDEDVKLKSFKKLIDKVGLSLHNQEDIEVRTNKNLINYVKDEGYKNENGLYIFTDASIQIHTVDITKKWMLQYYDCFESIVYILEADEKINYYEYEEL